MQRKCKRKKTKITRKIPNKGLMKLQIFLKNSSKQSKIKLDREDEDQTRQKRRKRTHLHFSNRFVVQVDSVQHRISTFAKTAENHKTLVKWTLDTWFAVNAKIFSLKCQIKDLGNVQIAWRYFAVTSGHALQVQL